MKVLKVTNLAAGEPLGHVTCCSDDLRELERKASWQKGTCEMGSVKGKPVWGQERADVQ